MNIFRSNWCLSALAALVSLLVACSGSQTEPDVKPTEGKPFDERQLRYEIGQSEDGEALDVRVTFRGAESGESTFVIPSKHVGQRGLYKGVRELEVEEEGVDAEETDRQNQFAIEHEPGALLHVRYQVVQTFEEDYRKNRFRPIIGPEGAFFVGGTVLGHPERMHIGRERPVELIWKGLSDGTSVVNSFGQVRPEMETRQSMTTAVAAVHRGIYLIGDVQTASDSIENSTVRIASLGNLPAGPDELVEGVVEMIRAQRTFFDDFEFPTYTVAMYGIGDCCWSVGDTVYRGFVSLFAQERPRAMQSHLVQLIAHEHLHQWIPDEMGSPRPFRAYMWFVEGFTEYYAKQFKLRTGVYDFEMYVSKVNEVLAKYWKSSARNANRTKVQDGFNTHSELTRLAYQRGQLLALNWNARIAKATDGQRSLDDVVHELVAKREGDESFRVSDDTLTATVGEIADGVDVSGEIRRTIDEGQDVDVEENALGPCAEFVPAENGAPPKFEYADGADCQSWFE